VGSCGLDESGSCEGQVAGSCEQGNFEFQKRLIIFRVAEKC
jgi:hypothetical protein